MTPQVRTPILLVDDENHVLDALRLRLRKGYDVSTASSGAEGLALLSEDPGRFAVVISDMRMPEMDGAAFLAQAHRVAPDTTRMLLTGHAEVNAAIAAVNDGHIFRFLTKPCPAEVLAPAIHAAVEQHLLATSQRALLRETLAGSIAMLVGLLELAQPATFSRAGRVSRRAGELARWTGNEAWPIEIAAQLSQIAAMTLPPALLALIEAGEPLDPGQEEQVRQLPSLTADLLARIPRMERVVEILRAVGQEAGDESVAWEGRALGILLDLDALEQRGTPSADAIALLRRTWRGGQDRELLQHLEDMLQARASGSRIREVALSQIRAGMVLAADVRDGDGHLLLAAGYEVTGALAERIRETLARGGVTARLRVEAPHPAAPPLGTSPGVPAGP